MHYVKLWSNIITSSLWLQDHDVIRVWIYLISQADPHGYVDATLPAIAHQCLITQDRAHEILTLLSQPDTCSRTPDCDGRRIEIELTPDWRIKVINYRKYREKDLSTERTRRYREKLKQMREREGTQENAENAGNSDQNAGRGRSRSIKNKNKYRSNRKADTCVSVGNSNAFALDDAPKIKCSRERNETFHVVEHDNYAKLFEEFWAVYPRKQAKKPAKDVYLRLLKASRDSRALHQEILQGVERLRSTRQWREGYVPHATTFLRQERWRDEPAPDEPVLAVESEPEDDLDMTPRERAPREEKPQTGEHYVEPEKAAQQVRELLERIGRRV